MSVLGTTCTPEKSGQNDCLTYSQVLCAVGFFGTGDAIKGLLQCLRRHCCNLQYPWHRDVSAHPVLISDLCSGSCWHLPPGIHTHPHCPPSDNAWLMLCYIMFVGMFYPIKALPEARCSVLVGASFFYNKHLWADVIFIQFSLWNFQRQIFAWQCHSRVWGRNCCPSASVYICTCTQGIYLGSTKGTANLNIHILGNGFIKSHLQAHSSFELCNHAFFFTRSSVLWRPLLDLIRHGVRSVCSRKL